MGQIGIIGCGKLGLPVALAIESRGHEVVGYDINPDVQTYLDNRSIPFMEEGIQPYLDSTRMRMADNIGEVVAKSDIVFCAIQTPHDPRFEGTERLPEDRADFNYTYLKQATTEIVDATEDKTTLAVISTCLPGTFSREIKPLLNDKIDYVYNPLYIAMGTVIMDYLHPEFVLIGQDSPEAAEKLGDFYRTIHDKPHVVTDITTAEGIKVSYNTWITAKTVLANAWGEMCEKLGMNFDDMFEAWSLATDRLVSPRYMKAGMPDGGGCHPRDNIALSHIAKEIGMSHNIWEDLMEAREAQVDWFARETIKQSQDNELPIVILGRSFKPETNIETGSGAILLANILKEYGANPQHYEDISGLPQRAIYFIGTAHERYKDFKFPKGSVVLDPHGIIKDAEGVTIVRIGRA
jgi:UDPglucose 6-dehydrogenase